MSNFTSIILVLAIALSFYAGIQRQIILIPTHELSDFDLLNMETLVPEAKDTFFYLMILIVSIVQFFLL